MSKNPAPHSDLQALSTDQLLDLFKHWDGIVSAKENLFVPVILAVFPAVMVYWANVNAPVVAALGAASVFLYIYHLMIIRRLAEFQDSVFGALRSKGFREIDDIVNAPGRRLSVRRLRLIALPILGALWAVFVCLKRCDDISGSTGCTFSSCGLRWVTVFFIGIPIGLAIFFYRKDESATFVKG